ncbi:cation diffusion facilitator family transporter [Salinicoccus hispanicus]|uniref:Cation diffusion facilitator family transporter n=1 Tax=Salinicoccus hispanicus TaxID=157225 RepID=A0A6N8U0B1_9STAP|nr:cation diffusion facilitator family transporter [Salinicoccus hispanicus]MXQ50356.1 cation diffusion facilitator family transporter [Salinicoccus hispanicus]
MKDIFRLLKQGSKSSLIASIVNFIIAGLKGVAFLFTANVAMFAEMMHSLGDAINQLFVYIGSSLSKKAPTERFPFGFGRLVNLVCLFAIIVVAILSYETIREGIHHIVEPLPTDTDTTMLLINIGVLAIAAILESFVLYKAGKEILQQTDQPYDGLKPLTKSFLHLNRAKPATKLVFMEDTVATAGALLAIIAILIARFTGFAPSEGIASVIIGLMMFYIVYRVFMENAAGVLGEHDPHMEERISQIVLRHDAIADIRKLFVLKEGDNLHVEVIAEIDPDLTSREVNSIRDEIEKIIMEQRHVTDVNMEFELDDGKKTWPKTQNEMDQKSK